MRFFAIPAAALVLLASCSDPDPAPLDAVTQSDPTVASVPLRVEFDCGKPNLMVVDFDRAAGTATVQPPAGNIVILPQRPTASGFRYESDGYELIGKGDEVEWLALLADPITCTVKSTSDLTPDGTP